MTPHPPDRPGLLRDPALLLLLLLPLGILGLNSRWLWSGAFRDPWIYYGFFQDAPDHIRDFHRQYYAARLSVILPGWLAHRLLPPLAAHLALHLAVYWTAVLSVWATARLTLGRRPALLGAIAMGGYPYFLYAAGWNYVDGFGIAYLSLALLLLTLAARRPRWRLFLVLAGVAAAALVTANPFYAVFLPFLAAHHLVASRGTGPLSQRLRRAFLLSGAGAAGLFALLGAVNRAFGGPFLYLVASLRWSVKLGLGENYFRHPVSTWIASATWLVVPAAILLGSLALLERARRIAEPETRRFAVAWQIQYLACVALMALLQVSWVAALETFFYASLLIPFAFLALAGQLAALVEDLSTAGWAALVNLAVALQLLPPALASAERAPELMRFPVVLPLLAGVGAAGVLWLGARGWRAGAAFLVCLGLSQLLMSHVSAVFRFHDAYDGREAELFAQIDEGLAAVRESDAVRATRVWYDLGEPNGPFYDVVGCAHWLCLGMINHSFPELQEPKYFEGTPMQAGDRIALLTSDTDAMAQAAASFEKIGLSTRVLGQREIPGPAPEFRITFFEIGPGVGAAAAGR